MKLKNKEMKIRLTKAEINECCEFAKNTAKYHRQNGRTLDKIKSNIVQGKCGEVAFHRLHEGFLENEPDLTPSKDADPGWDFVTVEGTKIDVKTIGEDAKTITINMNYLNADEYAIMQETSDGYKYLYTKTKEYMERNAKPSKFNSSYYVNV